MHRLSRREFTRVAAGAVTAPILSGALFADEPKRSANDRINLGFVGVGTMGRGHLGSFLGSPQVQVVAVCDVVAERRNDAKRMVEERYGKQKKSAEYKGCEAVVDFRDILKRSDIDAVVIATPDHWHAMPCILAARAKKDIYCEKPLTHNIAEGRRIVEEVARNQVIFQTGSQQRSEFGNRFRFAVELVRNGRIGKLNTIRIGVGGPSKPCDLPEQPVPEGTDWDFWQGPAPERGYNEVLCPKGIHKHFPAWRAYREYGGGQVADMGAHHFDIAQWALDMDGSGPVDIVPPEKGESGLKFVYANGVEMIHGGPVDCEFIGANGVIQVSRGFFGTTLPLEGLRTPFEGGWRCYPSSDHHKNWLECVRSRKETICPPEVGHRSASVCHLGNIGYRLRRRLKWDPKAEQFINDDEANKLTSREPRAKWKLV
jgi:predicted dehydrogenase